jgi:pentatricopeptide repeat protein
VLQNMMAERKNSRSGDSLDEGIFFDASMRYFSHKGDASSVEDVFAEMHRLKLRIAIRHESWRMHVYAAQGNVLEVERIWSSLFPTYTCSPTPIHQDASTSINSSSQRFPAYIHFIPLATAYANIGDADGMIRCTEMLKQVGHQPRVDFFNETIRCFAKRGDQPAVFETLQRMRSSGEHPNEATYLILIKMHGRMRDIFGAEKIFQTAIESGIRISQRLVMELMRAHVASSSWKGVLKVYDYIRSAPQGKSIWLDIQGYNLVLRAYVLSAAPLSTVMDVVRNIVDLGVQPDDETFLFAIQSACDAGQMGTALRLLQQLEQLPERGPTLRSTEAFALTMLIGAYLIRNMRDEAKEMYALMQERGIVPDSVTFGLIVYSYGNEGTEEGLRLAEEFLSTLAKSDSTSREWLTASATSLGTNSESAWSNVYRPLMIAHGKRLNPDAVEKHFNDFISIAKVKSSPSIPALTALMDAYRRAGDVEGLRGVWSTIFQTAIATTTNRNIASVLKDISTDTSTSPFDDSLTNFDLSSPTSTPGVISLRSHILCIPLSVYILGLSSAGYHTHVARTWAEVGSHGFGYDAHNWNHLAVALMRAGEPVRSFEVVERVILASQVEALRKLKERSPSGSPLSFVSGQSTPSASMHSEDAQVAPTKPRPGSPWPTSDSEIASNIGTHLEDLRLGRAGPVTRRDERMVETERFAPDRFRLEASGHKAEGEDSDLSLEANRISPEADVDADPPGKDDAIASAFHTFHQVNPAWNNWNPHRMTLHTLALALQKLEAGNMIQPTDANIGLGGLKYADSRDPASAAQAHEAYHCILQTCPRTLTELTRYRRQHERALKRGEVFKDAY